MKKLLMTALLAVGLNASAWAAEPVAAPAVAASAAAGASHPCHAIEEACKAAGFVKGGASTGKGLWKNCIKPILDGTAVSGVNVGADEVAACKAKKAAREGKH
jgi:opacity protein-like surface antigen